MFIIYHNKPFERPVIIGSELVSFSALLTCRHLGIRPVAMIEENSAHLGAKARRSHRQICLRRPGAHLHQAHFH